MTAFTKTQIANMALGLSGDQRITDLDTDNSEAARAIREVYNLARDYTLQAHPWNFARKYAVLAQTTAPVAKWTYAYTLPGDYLMIELVSRFEDMSVVLDKWEVAGGNLLTNEDAAYISYTARITTEGAYDPQFVDCFVYKLASLSAQRLTGTPGTRLGFEDDFEKHLRMARATLSMQQPTRNAVRSQYHNVRRGSRAYRL